MRSALAASRFRRISHPHPGSIGGGRVGVLLLISVVAVVVIGVIVLVPVRARRNSKPNILLITIDALRADTVGYSSDSAPPTPSIDRLASRGVAFSAAFSQAPFTLPSFASMMTSRYPSEAGVAVRRDASGAAKPSKSYPLCDSVPTLAGLLTRAGYTTAAIGTVGFQSKKYGLQRGFSEFTLYLGERTSGPEARMAEHVTESAIGWLERPQDKPFFLWLHYTDTHEPYGAPGSGAPTGEAWRALERVPRENVSLEAKKAAVAKMRELYRGEATYCDHWVGELLHAVDDLGLKKDTVVILTADHGEEFLEHGYRGHGRSLHDEVLRVPFIIAFPDGRKAGTKIAEPIRLMDIMPTVLELAHVQPPTGIHGESLMDLIRHGGQARGHHRELFAECLYGGPELKGLRTRDLLTTYRPSDGKVEFFSKKPLWPGGKDSSPETERSESRKRLLEWSARMKQVLAARKGEVPTLSPKQKEDLKALGYL